MGKQKVGSIRTEREVKKALRDTWESTVNLIKMLNQKMKDGTALRDEEIRFLKNSQDLIRSLEMKEESIQENIELPEGKLKEYVEKTWEMVAICKDPNKVIELTGYYCCDFCGQLHLKGRDCMYLEYQKAQNITESDTLEVDQNDHPERDSN